MYMELKMVRFYWAYLILCSSYLGIRVLKNDSVWNVVDAALEVAIPFPLPLAWVKHFILILKTRAGEDSI